jgi:tRNA threonylcarbamoyladenosine biosynthesis protein TsaB
MILMIETTALNCSVALCDNGNTIDCLEVRDDKFAHAEKLHPFIEELLAKNKLSANSLKAVSVSMGPGSYTGLRIGVSAAKGFAFALGIPMIAVSTLQMMTDFVKESHQANVFLPMIDARRMEVYTQRFDEIGRATNAIEARIIEPDFFQEKENKILVFGDGADKCLEMMPSNYSIVSGIYPSAVMMAKLSQKAFSDGDFVDAAYFEPFYLKDFVAGAPSTKNKLA